MSSSFGESEGSGSVSDVVSGSGSGSGSEWGLRKRLSSELGVGRRGGAVLGAVGRVPCASVDQRSLLV